jgi:hypothetical protein
MEREGRGGGDDRGIEFPPLLRKMRRRGSRRRLAPAEPCAMAWLTLGLACAIKSSNSAVSCGGARLQPTVILKVADFTGGTTVQKRHMGSSTSMLWALTSPEKARRGSGGDESRREREVDGSVSGGREQGG